MISSLHEGFSHALLEAWASGTPVVASSAGGLLEAIQSGTDGLLVEPRDPRRLVERILEVFEQLELRQRLVREGRKQLIVWPIIAERWDAVYRRVLA